MDINEALEAKAKEIKSNIEANEQKMSELNSKFEEMKKNCAEKSELESIKTEISDCKNEIMKL